MNACQIIITHFAHAEKSGETARESRLLCENIFARGSFEDTQGFDLSNFILPGLAGKIKGIKRMGRNGDSKA